MQPSYMKKTIEINQDYLRMAKLILKTKTDKETVNRALEIIAEEQEIINAHIEVGGAGEIEQVFK